MFAKWVTGRHAVAPAVAELLVQCGWNLVVIGRTSSVPEIDSTYALLRACCLYGRNQWDPATLGRKWWWRACMALR